DDYILIADDREPLPARLKVVERQAHQALRRRNVEESLHYRVELEKLIAGLSANFVNLDPDDFDAAAHRALQAIGEFAGVDRSYIFLLAPDGRHASCTHEWCAPGIERLISTMQNLSTEDFPAWTKALKNFETIHIPRVSEMPPEAASEKKTLEGQGVQSVIVVPLMLGRTLLGFVGFDAARQVKEWDEDDIRLLKMVGEILANSLERKRNEESLMEGEERFRRLVENAADAFFICDSSGNIQDVNQRACKSLGYTRGELLSMNMRDIESPPFLDPILKGWGNFLQSSALTLEGIHCRKDGQKFPVESRVGFFDFGGRTLVLALVRDITLRKRAEDRLRRLNETFLSLGTDYDGNIQNLTESCGILMRAACALYNRLQDGMLFSAGRWNTPPDYNPTDKPDGHICYDVISKGRDGGLFYVRNLPETPYSKSDPNVAAFGLKTYVGHPVSRNGKPVGSLCVVYRDDVELDDQDRRLMEIFASAISIEEERRLTSPMAVWAASKGN
ncbi:MAG TPA: PAS domain S-box protein, partial [Elusimicrobiota bacterium]|nr:PAS domain S-box protein [Elusimicrobiota bacterium]